MEKRSEQNDELRKRLSKIAILCKKVEKNLYETSGASDEEQEIKKDLDSIFEEVLNLELSSRGYLGRKDRPRLAKILQDS